MNDQETMSEHKKVPISEAAEINRKYEKAITVVLCVDEEHGLVDAATAGKNEEYAHVANYIGERLTSTVGGLVELKKLWEDSRGKWLIWSMEHNAWWKPAGVGYTESRADAGRYSYEDALQIVKLANEYHKEKPYEAMILETN